MWELCLVLLKGTFIFNTGENIGLVMVLLSVQLSILLLYAMHLTAEIEKYAPWLSNTNAILEFLWIFLTFLMKEVKLLLDGEN